MALERGVKFIVLMGPVGKIEDCSGLSLLKSYIRIAPTTPIVSFIVVDGGRAIVIEDR